MTGSASVSKDGHNAWTRGHPSRRAQGRAPQDEVGDLFTASKAGIEYAVASRFHHNRSSPALVGDEIVGTRRIFAARSRGDQERRRQQDRDGERRGNKYDRCFHRCPIAVLITARCREKIAKVGENNLVTPGSASPCRP